MLEKIYSNIKMGLFSKKKEVKKEEIPSLPKLPKLPEISESDNDYLENRGMQQHPHQLPSYPSSSLGTKFSHNTIKDAVSGERGEDEFSTDDFSDEDEDGLGLMERAPETPAGLRHTEEIDEKTEDRRLGFDTRKTSEPVFIRIDKFEEALDIFNESKKKISEIERVLEEIKKVKEKEERELQSWEKEIKSMKDQIEKVDRDIFSKV